MKALITLLTSSFIILTLLTACGNQEQEEEKVDGAENLLEKIQAEEINQEKDLTDVFLAGNINFSFDLFKTISSEENAFFSPVPIYHSLALLANGANETAKEEILASLGLGDLPLEEVNASYRQLINNLESQKEEGQLTLSNSIWYDLDFKANEDYLKTNKTYFDTDSFKIDYSNKESPDFMNNWISDQTNGKIEKMVDTIDPSAVMYLFSTIYFKADWKMPFKASDSYESEFLVNDEKLEVEKMTGRFELESVQSADEEGVILPYKKGNYSFIALMPKEEVSVRDYLASLNPEKLLQLKNDTVKEEIEILLPKFELSYEKTLNEALKEMGIQKIFDENENSLSGMGEADGNLFVNEILQKSYFTLDEKGTEAASAVSSEIDTTSMPMPVEVIDFNRPFLYGIIDEDSDLPLFLGIMDRPDK